MQKISPRVRWAYSRLEERLVGMPVGVPLPPVPELMRELSVSQATVERVYQVLESRGLIWRKKGKGVFVADRLQTGEVAVVLRPGLLADNASPYFRLASSSLIRSLQRENPKWQVRMHMGKHVDMREEFPATLDLLEPEVLPRLRGVFAFHSLYELGPKLEKAKVPVVYLGTAHGPNAVAFDYSGFVHQAVKHLAETGCKRVGFLGHRSPADSFLREAAAFGLECKMDWVDCIPNDISERVGYESFTRLWGGATRPDGVAVEDDIICNGALRAAAKMGVNLPQDLRLVTNATRGIELSYHLPVSRIEFDAQELTRLAVELMSKLVRGEPPPPSPIRISGRMIRGETT